MTLYLVYRYSVVSQRVLIHPCVVFKNQCQLNRRPDVSYTLFPWTMLVPIHNIYKNQVSSAFQYSTEKHLICCL